MDRESREAMGTGLIALICIIAFVIIVAAVSVGGWQAGWWFKQQDVKRQAQVINNNYATQDSWIQEVTNNYGHLTDVQAAIPQAPQGGQSTLRIEALGIAKQMCSEAVNINKLPASIAPWVHANCAGGTVSATSSLRKGTG